MKPVHQTAFGGPRSDTPGNCLQAALASVLEMALNDVPSFALYDVDGGEPGEWFERMRAWLNTFALDVAASDDPALLEWLALQGATLPVVASGPSPRGPWRHVVVVDHAGATIHDPHPNGGGLVARDGEPVVYYWFCLPYFPTPEFPWP